MCGAITKEEEEALASSYLTVQAAHVYGRCWNREREVGDGCIQGAFPWTEILLRSTYQIFVAMGRLATHLQPTRRRKLTKPLGVISRQSIP